MEIRPKLYLSPVIDLFNGEIIAYTFYKNPVYRMVCEMLDKVITHKRSEERPILHSDQGWHYQMKSYQNKLKKKKIIQSMSRKGNCLDNAVMENFSGILKTEFFYYKQFSSIEDFTRKIHEYIQWYNHKRIKLKLNGLSPVVNRQQSI